MHRFFIEPSQVCDGQISIVGPDARQIRTVLRLKKGESLAALDGSGVCYRAEICEIGKDCVTAMVCEVSRPDTEPGIYLTLAQGLPKGEKSDLVIQKGTELGISEYVGIISARSVVQLTDSSSRQTRWRRIAKEASEQCGRVKIPAISDIIGFSDALELIGKHDLAIMAWEEESATLLSSVLRDNSSVKTVVLFIGPEGGFTPDEANAAKSAGAKLVSLGRRVLRTETAALAASAIILNELEGHL